MDTNIFTECQAKKIQEERLKHQIDSFDPVFVNDSQKMEQLGNGKLYKECGASPWGVPMDVESDEGLELYDRCFL